jgi:hypothetical protein
MNDQCSQYAGPMDVEEGIEYQARQMGRKFPDIVDRKIACRGEPRNKIFPGGRMTACRIEILVNSVVPIDNA